MSRLRCIISLACLLLGPAISSAQVATGTPPFSSTAGGPDIINLGNLNIHIDAAILSKAGRGMPLTYALSYDSSVWYVTGNAWTPVPNWGWRQVTEALAGYVSYNSTLQYTWCNGVKDWITIYNNWAYHDPNGAVHPFPGVTFSSCTGQSGLASSTDGSGYTMSATGWDGVAAATVYTPAGKVIVPPVGSPSGPGTVTDSNGNQFNANVSGSTTSIYDTLSSATPALTITGSPLPTQLAYPSPAGSNATVTLTYTAYPIKTNFACSATQYTSSGNVNLLTDIQLPDGRYYHFQYEDTMGFPGYKTGRITSVQLPTGGTITYAYTGGDGVHNPIVCSDGSTPGIDRVTPDSSTPWHYSRSLISGSMWQTTVTTPNGDVTQMNFQFSTPNYYETKRVVNTGASSVVQTVQTCYNGAAPDCTGTAITLPITRRDVYLQLPSSSGTTAMTRTNYAAGGQVLAVYDYDFGSAGSGSPGALLRKNVTAYITLPSNSLGTNITVPNQVSILDGSGATQAQTTFTYDQGTPTATSGTPQHIAVTGSRENLTTMISGVIGVSNTLTRTFTYYDTGVVNTSTDVNGAATAYAFSSAAASCGNAFPTNVSMPLSLTRSMTWNCAGAVQTGATDENNQPTSVAYNDPAFWRPTASTDASSNSTGYSYSVTSATSSLSFNAGNSVVEQLTNLDSLARVSTLQKKQSPSSTYYDSVQTLYDALGRAYKTSIPYQGTAGQGGSAFTTTTFDGAGRTLTTTDVGGGSLTYSYNYNDVLVTVGPAPAGENTKRRQFEYDGLGRLKSVCEITSAGGSGSCGQANPQTGFSTVYTYDVMNHILSVSQNAQGIAQTRSFGYDQLGRMTYEGNPENGGTNYYYDHASGAAPCANSIGDLVEKTVAVGNVTCYAYDALHRVTAISYPSGTYAGVTSEKHFVYDSATVNGVTMSNAKGRLAEAYTGPNASKITDLGFSYTARGELADLYEKTPNSGGYYHPNQTYWANGAPNQLSGLATLPTITYGLDGEGRISTVSASSGQNPVTSTTYNAASLPTAVNLGSGDSDAFNYDPNTNRMNQYRFNVNGQSITGTLTWNANGTLQTQNITDPFNSGNTQNCSYGYDDLTRVTSANCGGAANQSFSYDPFGNINKSGSPYSFQPTYSTSTNRMTAISGFTPAYDANGNLLSDGSHTYSWNADGRPITIDGVNLTYDALGRMVEQNRSGVYTQIVYTPGGQKFALMTGQTLQKAFSPLPGRGTAVYNSTGLLYYAHSDHLGSVRFASTPSRTMYFSLAHAPFGEVYANSGSIDPAFTGQRQDTVSGLHDFLYREYSITGRWVSPDPAGLAAADVSNPQSWNRYAYVLNNPLSNIDPTGLECVWDDGSFDSIDDPGTGNPGGCGDAGGTWIDHSFFSDFGLGDWSGSASGDLAGIVSALQANFALVQTGSGLNGWMLVANGGAGPIDWSLLGPQLPTLTYSQQLLGAAAKGTRLAGGVIPTVCGPVGVFGYAGGSKLNGIVEYDSQSGLSAGGLLEHKGVGGVGTSTNQGLQGAPIVFVGEGVGAFTTISSKPQAGPFVGGDIPGTNLGWGVGAYGTITSVNGCHE